VPEKNYGDNWPKRPVIHRIIKAEYFRGLFITKLNPSYMAIMLNVTVSVMDLLFAISSENYFTF